MLIGKDTLRNNKGFNSQRSLLNHVNTNIIKSEESRIWLGLNALDLALTLGIIHFGGVEVMPVASWLLGLGISWTVFFRILATLISTFILVNMRGRVIVICNIVMLIIVCWNAAALVIGIKAG